MQIKIASACVRGVAHIAKDEPDVYKRQAVYYANQAVRWIEYGSYDLTKPADVKKVTEIRDELKEAIQELTLAEGIKPEDQAYIDTLQAAVTKGQEALDKGGYPPVQGLSLIHI